jgi:hypothetical protein
MNLALPNSLQDYHPTPELYFNPLRPIQATFAETTVVPPPPTIPEVEDLPAAAPVHTTQEGQDQSGSFFSNVFGWSSKKDSDGKHLHSLRFYLANVHADNRQLEAAFLVPLGWTQTVHLIETLPFLTEGRILAGSSDACGPYGFESG